jgi:hypothetical protein
LIFLAEKEFRGWPWDLVQNIIMPPGIFGMAADDVFTSFGQDLKMQLLVF